MDEKLDVGTTTSQNLVQLDLILDHQRLVLVIHWFIEMSRQAIMLEWLLQEQYLVSLQSGNGVCDEEEQ